MLLTIEINEQQVSAKRGETILTVLNRIGVKVPTLCYLSSLSPTGACRMCVVEVEGLPHLVPACSHQVEEWMQIHTHSPQGAKSQEKHCGAFAGQSSRRLPVLRPERDLRTPGIVGGTPDKGT